MTQKLAGRRILITGAASGMGRDIARLFALEGASLGLIDRNEQQRPLIAMLPTGLRLTQWLPEPGQRWAVSMAWSMPPESLLPNRSMILTRKAGTECWR
jgi:NAD(P)-dependent dehydrogenase (short-subunit alcohol dehydrogenase family)